jgi:transcriptional regulator with XRE-family HTH domain
MSKEATLADRLVGERVRLRRKELGLSQEKLGKAVGVTFQQIQKYENGVNRIGAGRLTQIGSFLDVPVSYFFDGLSGVCETQAEESNVLSTLKAPGAMELLRAYGAIESPPLRKAVLDMARSLASEQSGTARISQRAGSQRAR